MFKVTSFAAVAAVTASVTLAWNPSAGPDVAGYRVYYGEASQSYSGNVDASSNTSSTISGLLVGTNYFFAVTAYSAAGVESPLSAEISYTLPAGGTVANLVFQMAPNHKALLNGTAPPGYQFQVLASDDLRNWSAIGSLTANSQGSFQFIDPATVAYRRYYRLEQTTP